MRRERRMGSRMTRGESCLGDLVLFCDEVTMVVVVRMNDEWTVDKIPCLTYLIL